MNYPIALLSICIIAVCAACQPKPEQTSQSQASSEALTTVEQPRLMAENQRLDLNLPECQGNNCAEMSIERLSSNHPNIDAWVDQQIIKQLQQILSIAPKNSLVAQASSSEATASSQANVSLNAAQVLLEQVNPFIQSFLFLDQELKQLNANHQINLMIKPRILNDQAPLATVVLNSSSYLGGAHGSSAQQYGNFDLSTAQQILLDDIVLAKQKAALERAAYAVFKEWVIEAKLAENVSDYEQAWKFYLSDNFYLSQQGLILQYAEYEIGPYVVGLPKLVIAYEDLDGILKPEYLPKSKQVVN
ncbi:RsiV family protein [uncultured Acinetobacter sp.]|uniref:RsiV family protein n=1 Tax=uncultured Acinetobacter sp. TaxID=165433 RepID=UPI00262BC588|nr:RsiV family protein [uncultured Acinetobacter sp.]